MSPAPGASTKDAANPRSTRQLLDELDALMNQMLSLPVEDEPNAPPARPPAAASKMQPAVAATLTFIEPEEAETDEFEPVERTERLDPAHETPAPLGAADMPRLRLAPTPAVVLPPRAREEVAIEPDDEEREIPITRMPIEVDEPAIDVSDDMLVQDPRFVPFHREARPLPASSASWTTRTLIIWDRGFRRATRRLGPLGWLLRSSVGRVFLGLCGLGCWGVALAWLVRDFLQWPR